MTISNFTLRSWHRQLQIYSGAFGYLRRASLHMDQQQLMYESDVSEVLLQFKRSARNILCEIESAINATTRIHNRQRQPQQQQQNWYIKNIKPSHMLRRFNFKTNFNVHINATNGLMELTTDDKIQLDSIDLKFIKHTYFTFLRGIVTTLKRHKTMQHKRNYLRTNKRKRLQFRQI